MVYYMQFIRRTIHFLQSFFLMIYTWPIFKMSLLSLSYNHVFVCLLQTGFMYDTYNV